MYTDSLSTITFFRSYAETVKEKSQRLEERYFFKIENQIINKLI